MKEYDVTITEISKMTVTVEAESMDDAKQIVSDGWRNGEYVLDYSNFVDVDFEAKDPMINLTYKEMSDVFRHINESGKKHVCGYIVFSQSSFEKDYSEQSRTYVVSSNNKAYIPGAGGYSIFGSCLDGTDQCIRLEGYMRGDNHWEIDRCYMKKDDYEAAISQPVKAKEDHEER